ncbi:MAG: hypothetical protein IPN69_08320 [Acidobacteria bacterium]|nr:hypothetical protein [Acidobacteriota bacterium]
MTFIDHLRNSSPESRYLEVAFGRHVVAGDLAKSIVTGTSPTHIVTIQQILGEAFGKGWKGIVGAWFRGVNRSAASMVFHPGKRAPEPEYKAFTVDHTTNTITCAAHGYLDDDMVFVSGIDLADPLTADTIYFVRDAATNTFKVASLLGGTAIDLTDNGSGSQFVIKNDLEQGVDAVFLSDTPHSNTAWVRAQCPSGSESGIPDIDTKNNPPDGFSCIIDCQTGDIYDDGGDVVDTDQLLTNPADVLAFGAMEIWKKPAARIDWISLDNLRQIANEQVTPDYTTLPQGVGLTARYYDGDAFDTLKETRVDPVVQFDPSSGAPALNLNVDDFSARFEGKIRAKYSETYTFYLTHDNGGKLWVDNLSTVLIDQWGTVGTHSATIALTADSFYDIKLEWNESGSTAEFKLEWESPSQPRQTVPQDRLYPKNVDLNRFESHVAFIRPTTFADFLRQILFSCNGLYQDVGGKLSFFCVDELSTVFDFDESNIVKKNGFRFYSRFSQQELLNLPNRFIADGRDLESRYLEKFDPELFYDLPELQEKAHRIIEETVFVGNSRRWQVLDNLRHYAKLRTAGLVCEFDGMPQTLSVQPGDLVRVTHSLPGWTEKRFLVLEATDKAIGKDADERIIKCLEWT